MTPLAAAASGAVTPGGSRDGSAGSAVPSLLREGGLAVGGGGGESLVQESLHHCSGAAALSLSSEVIDHGRQQRTCASQLSKEGGRDGRVTLIWIKDLRHATPVTRSDGRSAKRGVYSSRARLVLRFGVMQKLDRFFFPEAFWGEISHTPLVWLREVEVLTDTEWLHWEAVD